MKLTKTCTKCKECKPITEFTRNTTFKDGRTYNCSECIRIYHVKRNSTPEGKLKLQERNLKRKEYHFRNQFEPDCCESVIEGAWNDRSVFFSLK